MNVVKSVLCMVGFLLVSLVGGFIAWLVFVLFSPLLIYRIARGKDEELLDEEDRKQVKVG